MLTITTTAGDLTSLLKLMSLPLAKKDSYIFNPVAPTFNPDNSISLIASDGAITQISTFKNIAISGITEPVKYPIKASKFLSYLDIYNTNDTIQLIYDSNRQEWQILDLSESGTKDDIFIPSITLDDVKTTKDDVPFHRDHNGRPLYKGGTISPNVFASVNASHIHSLFKKADKVGVDPRVFYFDILNNNSISARIGNPTKRDKDRIESLIPAIETRNITSTSSGDILATVSYALGFEEVISNLKDNIDFYVLNQAPLWIEQETPQYKVGYLIAPAVVKS